MQVLDSQIRQIEGSHSAFEAAAAVAEEPVAEELAVAVAEELVAVVAAAAVAAAAAAVAATPTFAAAEVGSEGPEAAEGGLHP